MIDLTNVLVATDFGASSDDALRYGRALARTFGGTLHVLHVVDDILARGLEAETAEFWLDAQRKVHDDAARHLAQRVTPDDCRRFGERAVTVVSANAADAIAAYAKESAASLIVMGTHGADTTADSGLGSVAERVVHTAPCPVLTIKHSEHSAATADPVAAASGRA